VLAALVALFAWFYERATNEVSLVRTGIGGRRVVIDGGVLAVPYFHEIARVNMQTLRLDVQRRGEAALITKDRLRVDVGAEFYVSVSPDEAAIARAAQTLGRRTFQPDQLRELIDGMLVDALRSVAARMTMDELHENRASFVAEVRDALAARRWRYGLQLDSVSLTALDQTPFAALDENNAFNAVGMRKLAEVIAKSKKERAEIDSETQVSVRRAAMEAARRKLEIDLEERRAEIAQGQEIETLMAAQLAEVAQRKADASARRQPPGSAWSRRFRPPRSRANRPSARPRSTGRARWRSPSRSARFRSPRSRRRKAAPRPRPTARAPRRSRRMRRWRPPQRIAEAERRRELALIAARPRPRLPPAAPPSPPRATRRPPPTRPRRSQPRGGRGDQGHAAGRGRGRARPYRGENLRGRRRPPRWSSTWRGSRRCRRSWPRWCAPPKRSASTSPTSPVRPDMVVEMEPGLR
jgi:hypothetical protein